MIGARVNPVRASIGLAPVRNLSQLFLAADLVLAYTAEPFEYPRSDWPAKVRLVGPGLWEPPSDPPAWLETVEQPLVLVTCSTLFQNDRRIVEAACRAFGGEPFDVVVTSADVDLSGLRPPANLRIERFVPHTAVLPRATCMVCHAGMGTVQKALSYGVPVVAVPFGRDQPEVARRVEVAGAGVELPVRRLHPDRLRASVRRAITLRPGAQRIAEAFARTDSRAAAADALEELLASTREGPNARPGIVARTGEEER
jgi:MGT family glycosyltransferase